MKWILEQIRKLERHASKPWYPVLLGLLSFAYHFILVVPVDALFITSSLIAPRRWIALFVSTSIGFAAGAAGFAYLVELYGTSIVERVVPGMTTSAIWTQSEMWMQKYGVIAVGGFSLVPFSLHALVALAGIHHMPLLEIFGSIFVGRFIKYGILGWLCAYLPSKVPLPKGAADLIRPEQKTDAK